MNLKQNDRRTGMHYEDIAVQFLIKSGIKILERNYRIRLGEIDIIACDADYICFIEVKFRRSCRFGRPAESVTLSKQRTIHKVAECWLQKNRLLNRNIRFDVIEMIGSEINYLKYAF